MSVIIRERKLAKGRIKLYLDIYNPLTKNRSYEFLDTLESIKNVNPEEVQELKSLNIEKLEKAKLIRNERERELMEKGTSWRSKKKIKYTLFNYIDQYQKNYRKRDLRVIKAVVKQIKSFMESEVKNSDRFLISELEETHILKFIDHLNNNYTGDTPSSYYGRFKKILLQANREKCINDEVYKNVRFKSKEQTSNSTLKKHVLEESEIDLLFNTNCTNNEVKRAFLFGCYTGLGIAEIRVLKWKNIINHRLITKRAKTGTEINILLSKTALSLLGEKEKANDLIFDLSISDTAINKDLKFWINKAGIDKNITFYCGRHTYATRLLKNGANLKTVSDSLAHKGINHTIKYLNYVNSLKDEATSNL